MNLMIFCSFLFGKNNLGHEIMHSTALANTAVAFGAFCRKIPGEKLIPNPKARLRERQGVNPC
jgi:hypothetical protein